MSAKDALNKFMAKHAKELDREMNGTKRTNEKPEWELTQKPCMKWFKAEGFDMDRVEARAVYDPTAGRYMHGQTASGFSDAVGCTPHGLAAFVEFKAPGKRSTLQPNQRAFLERKIRKGCFAVCVDSVECLEQIWSRFNQVWRNREMGISMLLNHLPLEPNPRRPKPDVSDLPF